MNLNKFVSKLILPLTILTISLSYSSLLLSEYYFLFDLFSHFQLQYLLLLCIIAIFSIFYKKFIVFIIALTYGILVPGNLIFPANFFSKELSPDIFYMNTYYYTEKHEQIVKEILKNSPDTVFLVEANKSLISELKIHLGDPILELNEGPNSFVMFSKEKITDIKIHNETIPKFISAKFPNFTFIGIHAMDPLTPTKRQMNLKYFLQINDFINSLEEEKFLLVGDFNNTIYSGTFRKHFEKYFEKNNYTWGTYKPWYIPIDHALANFPLNIAITKKLESDHKGLLIKTQ